MRHFGYASDSDGVPLAPWASAAIPVPRTCQDDAGTVLRCFEVARAAAVIASPPPPAVKAPIRKPVPMSENRYPTLPTRSTARTNGVNDQPATQTLHVAPSAGLISTVQTRRPSQLVDSQHSARVAHQRHYLNRVQITRESPPRAGHNGPCRARCAAALAVCAAAGAQLHALFEQHLVHPAVAALRRGFGNQRPDGFARRVGGGELGTELLAPVPDDALRHELIITPDDGRCVPHVHRWARSTSLHTVRIARDRGGHAAVAR